jgi:glucosylceramidase
VLSVDLKQRRQKVMGFGSSFTDAATINIQNLSSDLKERLIQSYFGANGLQYNFGRVPIAGTDFSTRPYTYDDASEPDPELTQWSLAEEDLEYKIPIIKRALEVVETVDGNDLKLFGSPWSPPKWMKTSNNISRGRLIDNDEIYRSYANYLVKFYQSYREHGVEFWGGTIQNEPVLADKWDEYYFNSLQLNSSEAIKLVVNYLGPALESAGYTKQNFKLMAGDDSLGLVNEHIETIMANEQAQKYIAGFAFHWYFSGDPTSYSNLTSIIDNIGEKIEFSMMTEACNGFHPQMPGVDLGSWFRGELYASDIIEDFRRQTGAWVDWNMALDMKGGPNWVNNVVDSPIIVDKDKNEFVKQPMYYVLAHFSRFMRPGSVVVGSKLEQVDGVSVLAAHIENTGYLVVNVLNRSNSSSEFSLQVNYGNDTLHVLENVAVEPRSINTILLKL